ICKSSSPTICPLMVRDAPRVARSRAIGALGRTALTPGGTPTPVLRVSGACGAGAAEGVCACGWLGASDLLLFHIVLCSPSPCLIREGAFGPQATFGWTRCAYC